MSETEAKRARIKDKIAKSQDRLSRDGAAAPAKPAAPREPAAKPAAKPRAKAAAPSRDYTTIAAEHPFLTLAGGIAAGVLLGALLPRFGGRFGRRALALATVAGEFGLAASRQAREKAEVAGREGLHHLEDLGEALNENTVDLRRGAARFAGSVAGSARSTGSTIAREAVRLAARARR